MQKLNLSKETIHRLHAEQEQALGGILASDTDRACEPRTEMGECATWFQGNCRSWFGPSCAIGNCPL